MKTDNNSLFDYSLESLCEYGYEIDFESGKYDYSYDIDAITGKIINSKKELED